MAESGSPPDALPATVRLSWLGGPEVPRARLERLARVPELSRQYRQDRPGLLAVLSGALGPRGLRGEAALVVSGAPESFVSEYLAHVEALEQTPVNV